MIIGLAKDFCEDGVDDAIADVIETLPHTILDEDFDLVLFAAFQDHDVLMLFDMPQVGCVCRGVGYRIKGLWIKQYISVTRCWCSAAYYASI
jgi:hypothetical protein